MKKDKLMKIQEEKEKFLILRKEIVGDSCREIREEVLKYHSSGIRTRILSSLENDGFDLEYKGTQYLATLITIFFHERKLYRRKDIQDKSYWDLSDWSNEHYGMLGDTKENVICAILSSIGKNRIDNGPIEDIVYEICDVFGYYGRDRDEKRRVLYQDLRKK